MAQSNSVYHQLGFYLAEALGLNETKMGGEEGLKALKASHAKVKAEKNPQSVIKEKPASKDPGSKSAKQDAAIKKAMGPAKVGYESKRTGKKGVAGLAADIKYAGGAAKREELPDQPSAKSVEKGTYRGK